MIFVTLVCCYFGFWQTTKTRGITDVRRYVTGRPDPSMLEEFFGEDTSSQFPLVVVMTGLLSSSWGGATQQHRRYYFWLFGYVAKLPYEHTIFIESSTDILETDKSGPSDVIYDIDYDY